MQAVYALYVKRLRGIVCQRMKIYGSGLHDGAEDGGVWALANSSFLLELCRSGVLKAIVSRKRMIELEVQHRQSLRWYQKASHLLLKEESSIYCTKHVWDSRCTAEIERNLSIRNPAKPNSGTCICQKTSHWLQVILPKIDSKWFGRHIIESELETGGLHNNSTVKYLCIVIFITKFWRVGSFVLQRPRFQTNCQPIYGRKLQTIASKSVMQQAIGSPFSHRGQKQVNRQVGRLFAFEGMSIEALEKLETGHLLV